MLSGCKAPSFLSVPNSSVTIHSFVIHGADKPAPSNADSSFLLTSSPAKYGLVPAVVALFLYPWIGVLKRWGDPWEGRKCEGRTVHHSAASRSKRHSPLREENMCFQITFLWKGSKHLITIITSFLLISLWSGCQLLSGFLADGKTCSIRRLANVNQDKGLKTRRSFWTPGIGADIALHLRLSADCSRGTRC